MTSDVNKIKLELKIMRKQKLVTDNIYHVYNRGVEKRLIFTSGKDYQRFIKGLIIFNDTKPAINPEQRFKDILDDTHNRVPLVDILAFCLMPNHYHLLLKQRLDGGITRFMRKLGDGYAKYFNLRQDRVGSLFQGRFKSVLIDNEAQFLYIPFYIHLNPLGLMFPDWREKGIKDRKKVIDFLDNYRWSSHADYRGKSNFPLVLEQSILTEYFNGEDGYSRDFYDFIGDYDFSEISDLLLE